MIKDGLFVLNDTTLSNIVSISKKQSVLEERRICELSELAHDAVNFFKSMLNEGYGIYEILSMMSEGMNFSPDEPHSDSLDENFSKLISHLKTISAAEKAIISEMLVNRLKEIDYQLSENDFFRAEPMDETITYVKNPLADEAFDVFSQDFKNPKLKYSKNFSDIIKALRSGDAQYAILPIEEKGGARLGSIAELIFAEDFKINSIIPVFGFEGNADMKYALISNCFIVPELSGDDDKYLEIRIPKDSASMSPTELFIATDVLSLEIYKINTIAFTTEEGTVPFYSIVFKNCGKDFSSLLVFLTLFSGTYTPVGIYKNLE